jgi:hypothetical protein
MPSAAVCLVRITQQRPVNQDERPRFTLEEDIPTANIGCPLFSLSPQQKPTETAETHYEHV